MCILTQNHFQVATAVKCVTVWNQIYQCLVGSDVWPGKLPYDLRIQQKCKGITSCDTVTCWFFQSYVLARCWEHREFVFIFSLEEWKTEEVSAVISSLKTCLVRVGGVFFNFFLRWLSCRNKQFSFWIGLFFEFEVLIQFS